MDFSGNFLCFVVLVFLWSKNNSGSHDLFSFSNDLPKSFESKRSNPVEFDNIDICSNK